MFLRITTRSGDSEDKSCGATVVDSGDVGLKDPNDPTDLVSEDMDKELDTDYLWFCRKREGEGTRPCLWIFDSSSVDRQNFRLRFSETVST